MPRSGERIAAAILFSVHASQTGELKGSPTKKAKPFSFRRRGFFFRRCGIGFSARVRSQARERPLRGQRRCLFQPPKRQHRNLITHSAATRLPLRWAGESSATEISPHSMWNWADEQARGDRSGPRRNRSPKDGVDRAAAITYSLAGRKEDARSIVDQLIVLSKATFRACLHAGCYPSRFG